MNKIDITEDNVKELWQWYQSYLAEFRKQNYSDAEPMHFEEYVENNIKECESCNRLVDEEYIIDYYGENICEECRENGYGE